MKLRQIELLRAVIRCETTVRAAQEIGLSQPAVSNAIKHMESQLGFALFERINNRLFPTPEAKHIYESTEPLFQMYEAVGNRIQDMKSNRMGSIRVLATPPLGHSVLPVALQRFTARKRQIAAHFDIRGFANIMESIEAGAADLGFVIGSGSMSGVNSEVFFSEPLVCVMPPDHPLTRLDFVQPEDLVGHAFISLQPNTGMGELTRSMFAEAQIPFSFRVEVRYCNTACMLVQNKVGVSLVDSMSAMYYTGDRLVVRPFLPERMVSASAIWSSKRPISKTASAFLRDVRDVTRKFLYQPASLGFSALDGPSPINSVLQ